MLHLNAGTRDLEILLIDRDALGYFAKVKVSLETRTAVIRWGLDFLTYRASFPIWARWASLSDPKIRVFLTNWTVQQEVTLQCRNENQVIEETRFHGSRMFLANIRWITHGPDDLNQLQGLLWADDVEERAHGLPARIALLLTPWHRFPSKKTASGLAMAVILILSVAGIHHTLTEPTSVRPHSTQPNLPASSQVVSRLGSNNIPQSEIGSTARTQALVAKPVTSANEHYIMPEIWSVPKGDVALTIDDGPSPYTMSFIRVLQQNHIHATFFFVGSRVPIWPRAVRAAYLSGDAIGVHSQTHPILTNLSSSGQAWQIVRSVRAVQSVVPISISLFRPPYGAFNNETTDILRQQHMALVLWNSDPRDWAAQSAEQIVQAVVNDHPSGKIIALNETPLTLAALPRMIQILKQKNLQFVVISVPSRAGGMKP